jgi:hypothetical protein
MAFDASTPFLKRLVWHTHHIVVAVALGLLTACGGGGGGGGGAVSSNPGPPTVTLTWSNAPANATVAAGTNVTLMGMYTYGDASINWTDESGVKQTRKLAASGSTEVFAPNKTTTYTLVSSYQGVSSAPLTVKVTPPVAVLTLTPAPTSILKGLSTLLTPSFSCTGGTITQSMINDGTKDIPVSSGTAIQVTPTQTTTYTLQGERAKAIALRPQLWSQLRTGRLSSRLAATSQLPVATTLPYCFPTTWSWSLAEPTVLLS